MFTQKGNGIAHTRLMETPRKQNNKISYKEKNELIQRKKGWGGAEQDRQTGVIRVKRRRKGR